MNHRLLPAHHLADTRIRCLLTSNSSRRGRRTTIALLTPSPHTHIPILILMDPQALRDLLLLLRDSLTLININSRTIMDTVNLFP